MQETEMPRTDALTRRYEDARGNLLERANIGAEAIVALQSTEWELANATTRTAQECVEICERTSRGYLKTCEDNADGDGISQSNGCDACAQAITERFLK